jgi:hypothetical protein
VDDVAERDPLLGQPGVRLALEGGGVEGGAIGQPLPVVGEALGGALGQHALGEGLVVEATSSPKKKLPCRRMSPNTLMRSPSVSTMRAEARLELGETSLTRPARCRKGNTPFTLSARGRFCM